MSFRISHLQNANSVTLFFSYSYIIGRGVGGKLSFLCLSPRLARQNRKNKLFIFYCLRTLPSSVSRKSFVCHSYENCWVWGYSSRIGATHMQRPISREDSLPILKTGAKPSRPFQIVSHRAAYPSASRSTEIFSSILNEHSKQRTDNTGSYPSFLDKIQRPLQFQFELRALRQVQFVPPARLHEIRRECPQHRSFGCFLFAFVLHAPHGADSRPRCGRFCGVMLVAGSPFDQSFLCCARFHTVVARHAHDFRDDRQCAKFCANLVEREPEFRPAFRRPGLACGRSLGSNRTFAFRDGISRAICSLTQSRLTSSTSFAPAVTTQRRYSSKGLRTLPIQCDGMLQDGPSDGGRLIHYDHYETVSSLDRLADYSRMVGNAEIRPVRHGGEISDCSEQSTGLGCCPPRHCRRENSRPRRHP